jgi:hypothetical protein
LKVLTAKAFALEKLLIFKKQIKKELQSSAAGATPTQRKAARNCWHKHSSPPHRKPSFIPFLLAAFAPPPDEKSFLFFLFFFFENVFVERSET